MEFVLPDFINSQLLGTELNDKFSKNVQMNYSITKFPILQKRACMEIFGAIGILQVISSLLSVQHNFFPPAISNTEKL
jgi:3-oxoacyl-[acyl-carrier-protein] synthase II